MRRFLSALLAVFLFAATGEAQPVTQRLDKSRSRLHFELSNDLLALSGKFNTYSGTLAMDRSLQPVKVELRIDASNVDIAPVENLPYLSPEAIFRALPEPIINFTSTKITPLERGRYRVQGKVRRGKREWDTSFVASMARRSASASEVFMKLEGSILDFATELPLQFKGTRDQGLIECRLVFAS